MTLRLAVLVPLPFNLDLYENDPAAWGASLVNNAELLLAVLDAAKVRSVIEVGAYAGNLTQLLLLWAEHSTSRPSPSSSNSRAITRSSSSFASPA
jgi:hypothetical protein